MFLTWNILWFWKLRRTTTAALVLKSSPPAQVPLGEVLGNELKWPLDVIAALQERSAEEPGSGLRGGLRFGEGGGGDLLAQQCRGAQQRCGCHCVQPFNITWVLRV